MRQMCAGLGPLLLLLAVGVGDAVAQEHKSTELQVWTIRATTKNKEISPDLRSLADKLKQQFKYTGFKLEARNKGSATADKPYRVDLTGGYAVTVTPKKNDGKKVTLQIEVVKDKKTVSSVNVTVEAEKFQLQGGWALDGGDALIIAVSAR
jgi:hypothetical protein